MCVRCCREYISENSGDGNGVKLESYDNGKDENPADTVFASTDKSVLAFNDSDDLQVEAAGGEIVVRASTIGAKKPSKGVILTIYPEPDAGTR